MAPSTGRGRTLGVGPEGDAVGGVVGDGLGGEDEVAEEELALRHCGGGGGTGMEGRWEWGCIRVTGGGPDPNLDRSPTLCHCGGGGLPKWGRVCV